jgi:Holliday junction resolvase RusA-like endonuclease
LLDGALEALVVAAFPIPKSFSKTKRLDAISGALRPTTKPDCDNIIKMLDALNGVVFADDKQIVEASILKIYSDKPELTVRITPWGKA